MVGAGAVVTRSIPPRAIVLGNPARIVGYTGTDKQIPPTPVRGAESEFPASDITKSVVNGVTFHKFPFISDMAGTSTLANRTDRAIQTEAIFSGFRRAECGNQRRTRSSSV